MPMKSTETMDYLAERIRSLIGDDPRVTEKSMFGGLTFLLNGHILVGTKKDGRILLSVGKEHNDAALSRPGATQMSCASPRSRMSHGLRILRRSSSVRGRHAARIRRSRTS